MLCPLNWILQPVNPWAEMARSNYCGDETVYLGVRLSKWLSPLKDWEKVILKMKKVGAAIKKRGGNFCSRIRMVNTYLTPCMGYFADSSWFQSLLPPWCENPSTQLWVPTPTWNLHSYLMLSSLGLKPPTAPSNCF